MKRKANDKRNIGVNFLADNECIIRMWMPLAKKVAIKINDGKSLPLEKALHGYWELSTKKIKPGD